MQLSPHPAKHFVQADARTARRLTPALGPMKNLAVPIILATMACFPVHATADLSNCRLSVYKVDSRHRIVGTEIVASTEVRSIKRYRSLPPDNIAWQVQLTPLGGAAIKDFTSQNVGSTLAVLCNGQVMSEAFVLAPFGSPFLFTTNGSP